MRILGTLYDWASEDEELYCGIEFDLGLQPIDCAARDRTDSETSEDEDVGMCSVQLMDN